MKTTQLNRRQILAVTGAGLGLAAAHLVPKTVWAQAAQTSILALAPTPPQERIWYGNHVLQFGDLRKPKGKGPFPLVIIIHGGYWRNRYNLDHISHLCDAYTQAGAATWSLEYRRVGDEGGAYPGTFKDIAAGIDYARELNKHCAVDNSIDLTRAVVVGHSAGGHLAVWAANREQIPKENVLWSENPLKLKGVVSLAGLLDLQYASEHKLSGTATDDLMQAAPKNAEERYRYTSPIRMLPTRTPITSIHGTKDVDVPIEISELYQKAAQNSGVKNSQYIIIDGADHYDLIDPRSFAWDIVKKATFDLIEA